MNQYIIELNIEKLNRIQKIIDENIIKVENVSKKHKYYDKKGRTYSVGP